MGGKKIIVRPRWSKVLADLRGNKMRALLVIASIAVGVFAIGTIANAFMTLSEDFAASYASVNPANVTIITEPFDDDLLSAVRRIPGVADAEGRRHINVRVLREGESGANLELVAIKDVAESRINLLEPKLGALVPADNQVLIGFDPMNDSGYRLGDVLVVELANDTLRRMPVVGIVIDQTAEAGPTGATRGYVTHSSLGWLGEAAQHDRLVATVSGDANDDMYLQSVAEAIEDKVEKSGRKVFRTVVAKADEHPQTLMVVATLGIFGAVGMLVVLLSSSLIFNTLNALLAQDLRQIGVMKLIGAQSPQILGMYVVLILIFGGIALSLAVPAAAVGGYGLSWFLAYLLKAHLQGFRIYPATILIQFTLALLVPLVAGFIPVNRGSRAKVQRAISNDRPAQEPSASSMWHHVTAGLQWLSRPVLLSLRNTFRRKGRLLLTLFTLIISGALFIAVFNARASMQDYMRQMERHFGADVTLSLGRSYRTEKVMQALLTVPGVEAVEAWSGASAEVLGLNGAVIENLQITAPPADSDLIDPEMSAGRWLLPGDGKVIVVSDAIRDAVPGVGPGDSLRLSVSGQREEDWVIAGMFSFPNFSGDLLAYAPFKTISGLENEYNHASSYRLAISDRSRGGQERIATELDRHLRALGFDVSGVQTGASLQEMSSQMIGIFVTLLLIMAVLTATVGSIGLTGTMGMNVLERTREIGIARAIGAVDSEIAKSVVIESALIGMISWAVAVPASFPISYLLVNIIGTAMQIGAIHLAVTPQGMIIWLLVVLTLTLLASILPARNASRLTIREVLAYE